MRSAIGRYVRIRAAGSGPTGGEIIQLEPLRGGMTDTLIQHADGSRCWYAMTDLAARPGEDPLPSRRAIAQAARARARIDLRAIRADLVREIQHGPPWPGAEFGKAILGRAIDSALEDLE